MNQFIIFLQHFFRLFIFIIIDIIIHELGHLIIAKKVGCKVDVFSIGFGKPIYSFEFKETRYNFTLLLFGGYCKLKNELKMSTDKDSFTSLPYYKKLLIAIAGCLLNIVIGMIFYIYGLHLLNFNIFYFGVISLSLGIANLLPIPCLDGSYPVLVWLEKIYGKEKGYKIMNIICKVGFIILMAANIVYLPYLFLSLWKGQL